MSLFFSKMLFGELPVKTGKGRAIKFSHADIDIRLTTGSMRERVLHYLRLVGISVTAKEIADGICSDPGRVHRLLKSLMAGGEIDAVKLEGSVTEYTLPKALVREMASEIIKRRDHQ